ncbi:DNA-processing protein DprA [Streptomyces sp. NPDC048172]|uniref:DNA-processing protein DprA n=1 Tax=Streptomyces sp. NPDC048172 TaxID=3365505 RepID=UPI00371F5746
MDSDSGAERVATVALLWDAPSEEARLRLVRRAVEAGGALPALREELGQPTLLGDPVDTALDAARTRVGAWEAEGITVLAFGDARYPRRLQEVRDMPGVLFARGRVRPDDVGVAVVGSRRASERDRRTAHALAHVLAERGVTVVSGLAAGIDTAAHRGALAAGGRTVGVIGTGIRRAYPPENHALHDEVADAGAVLSQFWPDTPPDRWTFPLRNAVMSGYSLATVVVAAGERSGARIQARRAIEHGRPVVLLRSVVEHTSWGPEFAGRPDVHVARDPDGVVALVERLVERPRRTRSLLDSLAAGR